MQNNLNLTVSIIIIIFCSCNKNTDQLPAKKAPPHRLIISAKINGLSAMDFVFEQTKISGSDTVWLSIKNNSTSPISNLKYVVELCKELPQTYDNCDLQSDQEIQETINPGDSAAKVYKWINKNIELNSSMINVGIISYSGLSQNALANVYSNIFAEFQVNIPDRNYYGSVRGYILADGLARFRLKGQNQEVYNAEGLFTFSPPVPIVSFDGIIQDINEPLYTFKLDSIVKASTKILIDTTDSKLNFKIKPFNPIRDTIESILILTKKTF